MLIAVYGASGYQAELVLTELSRQEVAVRLVGRNRERLESAAARVGIPDPDLRVADSTQHDTVLAALAGSDVVINCAGPFTESGAALVAAAIDAGVHYVDTAGEQLYVNDVFERFGSTAGNAGVTVVPATNDGCLPGDLLAHLIAGQAGPLAEITVSHFITGGGGPSRGSLRSAAAAADAMIAGGLIYDDGAWRTRLPVRHQSIELPDGETVAMAQLPLCEVVTIPRHVQVGHVESLVSAALKAALAAPLPPELISGLPVGPTAHDRAGQHFTYLLDAVDLDGLRTRGVIRGRDTYGTTAVIAVEAARRLASGSSPTGVCTAAQAFDAADFLNTLTGHHLTWMIQSSTPATR
ncbi:saccharopine dehydrogenase NADP-binding domain-containing protein [Nocardia rhamnosiphila]|uniref:saccharopine dehydrogenase NADP-binding domain-containing protein n=1 Tax=Nocardia rhamnosiphila TaxID=426716 RepID=UPI0033FC8713